MKNIVKIGVILVTCCMALTACNGPAGVRTASDQVDILTIHSDGKMVFKDKVMPVEDVIIYADGRGGEKAAVKVYAPFHPPFYRDSIIVERLDPTNGS